MNSSSGITITAVRSTSALLTTTEHHSGHSVSQFGFIMASTCTLACKKTSDQANPVFHGGNGEESVVLEWLASSFTSLHCFPGCSLLEGDDVLGGR